RVTDAADDTVRHPVWLTAVATEVAQLDAEWERAQFDRHAISVRAAGFSRAGGWSLRPPSGCSASFLVQRRIGRESRSVKTGRRHVQFGMSNSTGVSPYRAPLRHR